LIAHAAANALFNVIVLVAVPFFLYWLYHRIRHKRSFAEVAKRAGLAWSLDRYLAWSAALAVLVVVGLLVFTPSLEALTRKGSAMREFAGLGLSGSTLAVALLYGVVKTGFAEEFLFRGLLTGSLARRLPHRWANLVQALIFLAPHLLLLKVMPGAWVAMPIILAGALVTGWIRIESGSIVGPWLVHATANVTTALLVAGFSAP